MQKYAVELLNYWEYKVLAGLWATFYSDDLPILFLLFVALEMLDIFTRWLALSRQCFLAIYPQTPCNLYRALVFMWQARRWRFIRSTGLRDGFCDKMLIYLILLLLAATVDGALTIVHIPGRVLLTIVTTVLATTEGLSILENLSECGVPVIKQIKDKFQKKLGGETNDSCK